MDDFPTLEDFETQITEPTEQKNISTNYCQWCNVPTNPRFETNEQYCPDCGEVSVMLNSEHNEHNDSFVKIVSSSGTKYINNNPNNSYTQKNTLISVLTTLAESYKKKHNIDFLNAGVLADIVNTYIYILETCKSVDANGEVKKRIFRNGNKDATIAAIIYYHYNTNPILGPKEKKDVEDFMNLRPGTFNVGNEYIRSLCIEGVLKYKLEFDNTTSIVEKHLESLGITTAVFVKPVFHSNDDLNSYSNNLIDANYCNFVVELVQKTEDLNHLMRSKMNSKIAGGLSILLDSLQLQTKKPAEIPDKAFISIVGCQKTTYQTFKKFIYGELKKNDNQYSYIFIKYNIIPNLSKEKK